MKDKPERSANDNVSDEGRRETGWREGGDERGTRDEVREWQRFKKGGRRDL